MSSVLSGSAFGQAAKMGFSVWEIVNESECKETLTFLGEKEFLLESAEQVSTKAYKLKAYRKGFFTFSQRTTSHNDLVNCSGTQGLTAGRRIKLYVKFNDDMTEMSFYSEPDEDTKMDVIFRKREFAPE